MKTKTYGDSDLFDSGFGYDDGYTHKSSGFRSCYHDHPVLLLGGGKFIGGSCMNPVAKDADVYIGFDTGMRVLAIKPWEREVVQVYHHITDMHAPSNPEEFRKLVNWTAEQLKLGKTVHAGCIGGHGRTGTFLSALLVVIDGEKDAINRARKIYCQKAVESAEQIRFLEKHFGVLPVTPSKGHGSAKSWTNSNQVSSGKSWNPKTVSGQSKMQTAFQSAEKQWKFVKSHLTLWGSLF